MSDTRDMLANGEIVVTEEEGMFYARLHDTDDSRMSDAFGRGKTEDIAADDLVDQLSVIAAENAADYGDYLYECWKDRRAGL